MPEVPFDNAATLAPRGGSAAPNPDALPRPFGPYRLDRLLGQGGMGAVYLAFDTRLNRTVAVKISTVTGTAADHGRSRFLREAQSAAALQHPNICPVFDVGEIDGTPYLAMAYIAGEPLAQRILANGPMPPRDAVGLVRKLALAIQHAHERGVIHRDLKPANILMDERGEPVVLDFGLGRRADLVGEQLTQQGDLLGTPAYMPPEQITGDVAQMGPASDIYSLGVILYELLTGVVPFQGDLLALVAQVPLDDVVPPSRRRPELDPRLDGLCARALAKKPADRYPSMRDFAYALDGWLDADRATLTLRVVGTPFSYRPRPDQALISVGRQRRKLGDPDDAGNDMVLRVPGDDAASTRISRRHFELHRDGDTYFVTDRSKAGTHLNGLPLSRGVATPLTHGDRLTVAGVVELEVVLDAAPASVRLARPEVRLREAGFVLEATLGDMVTVE